MILYYVNTVRHMKRISVWDTINWFRTPSRMLVICNLVACLFYWLFMLNVNTTSLQVIYLCHPLFIVLIDGCLVQKCALGVYMHTCWHWQMSSIERGYTAIVTRAMTIGYSVCRWFLYYRAQTNSGFYYLNILYSQLPNIRVFFFSIGMDEISIILRLYKMSL